MGGLDLMWGAVIGGIAIEFLPLWAQRVNPALSSVVYGIAEVAIMMFMPIGIAGALMRIKAARRERREILTAENLTIRFGGIAALADVSFDVVPGQITGLIGPNGAGKTTCFNCITRLYQPASGTITFNGEISRACPPTRFSSAASRVRFRIWNCSAR